MSNILIGSLFKLSYSNDPANNVPMGGSVREISNLAELPTLEYTNVQENYETFDSGFTSVLLSQKNITPFDIVIHYVPTDESTVFLDSMAKSRDEFQVILNYRHSEGTIDYAIVYGTITASAITGEKDDVVNKAYTFTTNGVISDLRTIDALEPLYEGSYGVGSNGRDVPQYEPEIPDGNSFIKVPADQMDNPVNADMMGISLVDGNSVCKLAITKYGNLNIYAMNASTAWTRILTATQISNQYVSLTGDQSIDGNKTFLKQVKAESINVINGVAGKTVTATDKITGKSLEVTESVKANAITATASTLGAATATTLTLGQPLTIANGGTGATTAAGARTNLGIGDTATYNVLPVEKGGTGVTTVAGIKTLLNLGTAAYKNIGTTGDAVPLLNTLNHWASNQFFDGQIHTFSATQSTAFCGMNLGSQTIKSDFFIDFYTNGTNNVPGSRIYASGGNTSTANSGILNFESAETTFYGNVGTKGSMSISGATRISGTTYLDGNVNINGDVSLVKPLPIVSGGTGANTYAQARTNLGIDRLVNDGVNQTTISSPDGKTLLVVPNEAGNWGVLKWNGTGYDMAPLGIAGGGTGATDVNGVRNNLALGTQQTAQFGHLDLNVFNQQNSGILNLNRLGDNSAVVSQSRVYNEVQAGVSKTTFHTSNTANNKNSYIQFTEDGNVHGVTNFVMNKDLTCGGTVLATTSQVNGNSTVNGQLIIRGQANFDSDLYANKNLWVNQGYSLGVRTLEGGAKNILLQNVAGDGTVGSWVNLLQGNWYNGYWQLGAIRGGSDDLDHVRMTVNNGKGSSSDFKFYTSYGGHIISPFGFKGSAKAGAWGLEQDYMGSPFWTDTVSANDGGWVPLLSGGSQASTGYNTRIGYGVISGGTGEFSSAAIKLLGDGSQHRGFTFSRNGDINTWGQGNTLWEGSYIFNKAATSDRTLKHDIQYTTGKESYDRVMQWLPTMFKYNGQDTQRFGLIAQDLESIDPQYVKKVPGAPIFEEVEELDEETGETKTVSKQTDKNMPDTLALDNNVIMTDLACAFVFESNKVNKLESEIDELKALVQEFLDK